MELSTNRIIARNMFFNILVFIINTLISFFLSPYIVRTIGKEAYGFMPLIGNLVGYTSIITTAVGSMAGRFVTMELYKGNKREAESYYNSVTFAYWILSLFFSFLLLICVAFINYILDVPPRLLTDSRWLLLLSGLSMIIGLLTGTLGMGCYIKNRVDLSASRGIVVNLVNAGITILLYMTLPPNIVYGSIAGFVCALLNVWFNIQFKKKLLPEFRFAPLTDHSWKKIFTLVSSGIWNSVNQLSNILLNQIDLLIANIFISAAATGEYALVKIVPNLIYTILAMLSGTFTANFNILYAKGENEQLFHEIKKSCRIVGIMVCVPIGFLMVFADQFFHLWVPGEDNHYLAMLSLITIAPMIFGSSVNPIFGVFSITNKLRTPSLVVLGAGLLNALATYIVLKTTNLGLWAIPIVGAIQHGLRNFFFTPIYAAYCLKQKWYFFYTTVFKCIFGLFVVILVSLAVRQVMNGDNWLMFILEGIVVSVISLFINSYIIFYKTDRQYIIRTIKAKFRI